MKRWFAVLALCVLALGVLMWFMPARWALSLLQPQLRGMRFEQVSGTLWQGRAAQVSIAGGPVLGSLAWTLSHRALLGDIRIGLDLRQPQCEVQGQVHRLSATEIELHQVRLRMDMAVLGPQAWLHGQPQGRLDVQVPQARLQGTWPMQLDAQGTWSPAAVRDAGGEVPLGAMQLVVSGRSGVLQATLQDDGSGPLQTAGRLSFSPLGWDLSVNLKPRADDPALLRWLRSFGPPAADGTLELRYRGGLAQMNPAKS